MFASIRTARVAALSAFVLPLALFAQAPGYTPINTPMADPNYGISRLNGAMENMNTVGGGDSGGIDLGHDDALRARAKADGWKRYAEGRTLLYQTPGDDKKAKSLLKDAAFAGIAPAEALLGWIALTGYRESKDPAAALKWYRAAAKHGRASEQKALGVLLANGDGVPRDAVEGYKWIAQAATWKDPEAQLYQGSMKIVGAGTGADPAGGVEIFRSLAEKGDPLAAMRLAACYEGGCGVAADSSAAKRWRESGVRAGLDDAHYRYIAVRNAGWGDPGERERSLRELRRLAGTGDAGAQLWLAGLLDEQRIAAEPGESAPGWRRKAAEAGAPAAQFDLGRSLWTEAGADDAKRKEAASWFEKAAAGGEPRAMWTLGLLQWNGEGVAKNPASAYAWLVLARESGVPDPNDLYGHVVGELSTVETAAGRKLLQERRDRLRAAPAAKPAA